MKDKFLSKAYGGVTEARRKLYGLGLPRQWKVITSTLLLLFTLAIGNVWGAAGDAEVVSLTSGNITANRAKAYAVVTDNDVLEDGAIYATSRSALTANADNGIEPSYMGFLFKPIVNCKVVLKGINTTTSVRNFSNKVYEVINTDMYPIVKASSSYEGTISKYLLDNYTLYTTRTQSEWKDVKLIKYSSSKYQEDATNAAKTVTGESAQTALYTQISDIQVISIAKKASSSAADVEESKTFATEDGEYIFQAGKTYAIYLHRNSSGLYVKDLSFVPVYQLTWELDGGTITSAADAYTNAGYYAKGTELTAPTVTKAGADFAGWSPALAATMPAAATTYTATWATACSAGVPGNVTKGALTAGEITLTAEGSAASGDTWYWQTSESGVDKTNAGSSFVATAAGTYYVRSYNTASDCWNVTAKSIELTAEDFLAHYAITYNKGAYGTGEIAGGEKVEGVAYTLSSDRFTRAGYVQVGWATTNGGAKAYDLGGSYTTDAEQEFFPVWAETSTYVASFNSGEGCSASTPAGWTFANAGSYGASVATADYECKFGENFPTSAAEVVKNASYIAFAKADGACATYDLGSATTVSALAGTFYVGSGSERTFTIEYLAANGTTVLHTISTTTNTNWGEKAVNDATVVPNVKYIRINPAHAGSSYSWLVMKAFSVTYVDLVTKYDLTFAKNGGSGDDMTTLRYAEDALVTLPGCTFTAPTNKTFDAWVVTKTASGNPITVTDGKFTMPAEAVTATATWKFLPKLTLTAGEGATGEDVVAYYAAGTQISVPEKPAGFSNGTKEFTGWVYSQAVTIEADKFAMPSTDLTLTAQWASATAVAQILGGDSYETFADAIAAVADGQTIQLLQNCESTTAWTIAGKTVTLDMNGKNLTGPTTGDVIDINAGGKLILTDNAATEDPTINGSNEVTYAGGKLTGKWPINVNAGGEFVMNGGWIVAGEAAAWVGYTGKVTINNGVLEARDNAVVMAPGNNGQGGYTIDINGGILLGHITSAGYASACVYHPNTGVLNISGGTLVSTDGPAVVVRAGESHITGGTIISQGDGGKVGDASAAVPAVGVVYDFKANYPGEDINAAITAGNITSVAAIYAGTTPTTAEEDAVAISGGTFNSPVAQALCAENYAPKDNGDGTYGVKPLATSIDFEALATTNGSGTTNVAKELGDHNYTFSGSISTDNGASWDVATAAKPADKGLKIKGADGVTLSFDVAAGKLVTLKVGSLKGSAQISKNGGEFVTLTGADPLSTGASVYTYYYDAAQASYVIKANGTDYHVLQSIKIEDPYEVSYNTHGGDPIAEQYFYGTAITLPTPTYGTQSFKGWYDAEDGDNKIGDAGDLYIPTADVELHAHWEAVSTDARLASITLDPSTGVLSPAFDPEVVNYTYTMPYGTAAIPQITGATAVNAGGSYSIVSQASAWDETAVIRGVAASSDTKAYNITMKLAPKDGVEIIGVVVTGNTEGTVSGLYKGTASIKLNNKKLDNGDYYIYVTLKEGYTFEENDVLIVDVNGKSDLSGGNKALEITTGVGNIDGAVWKSIAVDDYATGENTISLAGIAAGQTSIGLKRSTNQNAKINGLRVLRPMNPVLKKVTVATVEGTPDNTNHVAIEVPASTADAALDAITYDWVSNSDAWTAAHAPVVANTWEFGVENTVTFTDKDGDASVYYVTISKAVPSSDATLATLTYGTPATAIALADGVFEYNVELPYGTSAVPTLAATAHHAGANVTDIDDAAAFVNRHATSTVTVKAEDNTTTQLYTVNFTVDRYESKVLWDGATMAQWSDITTAAAAAGVSVVSADASVTGKNATFEDKSYTKCIQFGGGQTGESRYLGIEVPAGKVAKVSIIYRPRSNGERSIIIGTAKAGAINESAIVYATTTHEHLDRLTADIFAAGTIYINTTNGYQVFEINVQLADGYGRSAMLGAGVLGTVCVPNNVAVEDIQGVTVYELMGRESQYGKLAFDEIISGELEAGVPYVFQAHRNHMALLYGETHVANPVDKHNGMYGTFTEQTLTELNDVYYFAQKALWGCADLTSLKVPANRAYVKLSEVDPVADPNPAPGRRRISMAVNGEQIATGIENTGFESEAPRKVLINGELFIIRGEKMYDAKGQLVK